MSFDVISFYEAKAAWSRETFGPKQAPDGVIAHLRKELDELRAAITMPDRQIGDVASISEELADICLLAIDLSWRAGGTAADFRGAASWARITPADAANYIGLHLSSAMPPVALAAVLWDIAFRTLGCDGTSVIEEKFARLKLREWPDWRTLAPDQPIEHVREPLCATCNDSHRMSLGEREVPCTRCPRPCDRCRVGGYCRAMPCLCRCHGIKSCEPVTVQVEAAASSPSAVAAEVTGRLATWSETATAMVAVERLPDGTAKMMPVRDLIAQWRERGDKLDRVRDALHRRTMQFDASLVALDALIEERAEWRADNERLRAERQRVREVLGARPDETVEMAARRVVALPETGGET